jgi:GxxExxY protein
MPVTCDLEIESLSTEEFSELDYLVMGHAFQSHNQLGRLADERIYETSLASRLIGEQIEEARQVPVIVTHRAFVKEYFLDLVVSRKGVYELKTVAELTREHVAQLLTYLYLLDLPRGKLVNFRKAKLESEFVNAPLTRSARTSFAIECRYRGELSLVEMTVEMLLDLGTSLSVSLYNEILVHLLGGAPVAMLPMTEGTKHFGKQPFHLVTPMESLRVTCFSRIPADYDQQLRSLLQFSPLQATHWINIDPKVVTFRTVTRNADNH